MASHKITFFCGVNTNTMFHFVPRLQTLLRELCLGMRRTANGMFRAILWPYKFADKQLRLSVLSQMGPLSHDDVNNLLFAFQPPKTVLLWYTAT